MNQSIPISFSDNISVCIKREDLLHPFISGNKFRKLKYNIAFAKAQQLETLVTFGGAYSNHIAATAAAAKVNGLQAVGIIRGEELGNDLEQTLSENPTLHFAHDQGMKFHFVKRSAYREKEEAATVKALLESLPSPYLIPEGGSNELAVKGCTEILTPADAQYNFVCCSVGTGGTLKGLIAAADAHQHILGFPALKSSYIKDELKDWATHNRWSLINDYHFGGYAKVSKELITFMNTFFADTGILLDPIYTAKLMYGVYDLIEKGYFPENSRILAIHTGGLQGIAGMNMKLAKKGLPIIHT